MTNHQLMVASYYARPQGSKHLGRKYFHDHHFHVESSIFPMVIYNLGIKNELCEFMKKSNEINLQLANPKNTGKKILFSIVFSMTAVLLCLFLVENLNLKMFGIACTSILQLIFFGCCFFEFSQRENIFNQRHIRRKKLISNFNLKCNVFYNSKAIHILIQILIHELQILNVAYS